jgi:hypothetical protein
MWKKAFFVFEKSKIKLMKVIVISAARCHAEVSNG